MKKLSKVLSLVLVIAMVFSLCVIGASANNYKDYTDAKDVTEDYTEAVDVLMGLGIVNGRSATQLAPKANYTRAEAAKIITYMQLGVKGAEALTDTTPMFKDVAANHWAAKYINYCAKNSIIGGFGDGTFRPDTALTGYQWAKMCLCAVGFGVNKEYTGSGWQLKVAGDGLKYKVFSNVLSASTNNAIAREQAMQMAFNTLTVIPKVTYSSAIGDYISITGGVFNGVTTGVNGGTLGVTVFKLYCDSGRVLWNAAKGFMVDGTYKYGATNTAAVVAADGLDYTSYDYAAHVWFVRGVNNTPVSNGYVDSVVIGDVLGAGAGLISKTTGYTNPESAGYVAPLNDAAATELIVTGSAAGASKSKGAVANDSVAADKRGVAVSLLDEDGDGDVDAVSAIQKTVVTLTGAPVTKTVNGVDYVKVVGITGDYVKVANVVGYKDLAKGDVVLYFKDCTGTYRIEKAESFTGTMTGSTTTNGVIAYTIGDGSYKLSGLTGSVNQLGYTGKDETYYKDNYKNIVATKADTTDYTVFVLGYSSNAITGNTARVLFADGTVKTISVSAIAGAPDTVDANGTVNEWATYSMTSATTYALDYTGATYVEDRAQTAIANIDAAGEYNYKLANNTTSFLTEVSWVSGAQKTTTYYGDADTMIYVGQKDGSYTVCTGILNAPAGTPAGNVSFIYNATTKYVSHVVIAYDVNNALSNTTGDVFFYGKAANNTMTVVNGVPIYTIPAVVDGKTTTVNVATTALYNAVTNSLYTGVTYNKDGVITGLGTLATANANSTSVATMDVVVAGNAITANGAYVAAYNDATVFFYVNTADGSITDLTPAQADAMKQLAAGAEADYTFSKTLAGMTTCVVFYNSQSFIDVAG